LDVLEMGEGGRDSASVALSMRRMLEECGRGLAMAGFAQAASMLRSIAAMDTVSVFNATSLRGREPPGDLPWWTPEVVDYQAAVAYRAAIVWGEAMASKGDSAAFRGDLTEFGVSPGESGARGSLLPTLVLARLTEGASNPEGANVHQYLQARLGRVLEAPYESLLTVGREAASSRRMDQIAKKATGSGVALSWDTLRTRPE
jgi:hypothetical protein